MWRNSKVSFMKLKKYPQVIHLHKEIDEIFSSLQMKTKYLGQIQIHHFQP